MKRMVELHEGTISIDSRGAGRGTAVSLRLPVLKSSPPEITEETPPPSDFGPSTNLLLVNDDADAFEVLRILLELEGHKVVTAACGEEAIRTAAEHLPDVAIIDIGMPDMDGFEVARTLRFDPEFANTLLTALTGYAAESDKSRALAAGFDHHFVKPLSLERLRDVLSRRDIDRRGLV